MKCWENHAYQPATTLKRVEYFENILTGSFQSLREFTPFFSELEIPYGRKELEASEGTSSFRVISQNFNRTSASAEGVNVIRLKIAPKRLI